jgi:HEAT repeat protein
MQDTRDNPPTNNALAEASLEKTMELLSFRALNDSDPMTRKHSVYLLGQVRDPRSVDTCIQAMRDPEKAVRGQASMALAEIGGPALDRLILLLHDPDWKVRYRAAETLGILEDTGAISPLIGILSDEKDHVRYMAVKSLCRIGDPAAREPITACQQDENPFVRRMADIAVSTLGKRKS